MRSLLAFAILVLAGSPAMAQSACKAITDSSARLACYDKAAAAARASTTGMGPMRPMTPARGEPSRIDNTIDPLSAGDDVVNARMNGICRGC